MRRVGKLVTTMVLGAALAAVPKVIQAQQKSSVIRVSATVVDGGLSIAAMDSLISRAKRDSVPQRTTVHSGVFVIVEDGPAPPPIEGVASLSQPTARVRTVTIQFIS